MPAGLDKGPSSPLSSGWYSHASHVPQGHLKPLPFLPPSDFQSTSGWPGVSFHRVQSIYRRALKGELLHFEDGVTLYHAPDVLEMGMVANHLTEQIHGKDVFFNVNRHINPTNICALSCKFCAFSRKPGEEGSYTYSEEQLATKAKQAHSEGATEIHMVGGLHPRWNLSHYTKIISTVMENAPGVHIKAFTAVEIDWLARRERKSPKEVLMALQQAGLGSMPGGGAEIFDPRVRPLICDTKLTGDGWLEIHKTAHSMGLRSNATMLYGHMEDVESRVYHLLKLRDLQAQTEGFNVFIPLSFQPENNDLGVEKHTYGVDDLKNIAISRLLLPNFRNIKSYWVMTGEKIAQMALHYGANDLDGTVLEEKIANMAGSVSGMVKSKDTILALIRGAQKIPVERNTIYQPIRRYDEEAPSLNTNSSEVRP